MQRSVRRKRFMTASDTRCVFLLWYIKEGFGMGKNVDVIQ
jgi:hypothetical protein